MKNAIFIFSIIWRKEIKCLIITIESYLSLDALGAQSEITN
jgi:hypothetical protein